MKKPINQYLHSKFISYSLSITVLIGCCQARKVDAFQQISHATIGYSISLQQYALMLSKVNNQGRGYLTGSENPGRMDRVVHRDTSLINRNNNIADTIAWKRHLIVKELANRAVYILAADLNGDQLPDIVAGDTWYQNPGEVQGPWRGKKIGGSFHNMAALYDFDQDGYTDILGTEGIASEANANFVWAKNDGKGNFEILHNVPPAEGDFLQGVAVAQFKKDGPIEIALSWHAAEQGVQLLTVPDDPVHTEWSWRRISDLSQDEDLSIGDINQDGWPDIYQGTQWLENPGSNTLGLTTAQGDAAFWKAHSIGKVTMGEADRNDLHDFNQDGYLDAVVGLEKGSDILLFLSGEDPTQPWKREIIDTGVGGGFSMDAKDVDGDGDVDVVLGEHRGKPSNRVIFYENADHAQKWIPHIVDDGLGTEGIDHHDGTVIIDIDGDHDQDIISIGWYNPKIWIYENKSSDASKRE